MDSPAHSTRPPLAIHELREGVERNEIDTVLVVFPDLAGSWKGKRMTGRFFLDDTVLFNTVLADRLQKRGDAAIADWFSIASAPDQTVLRSDDLHPNDNGQRALSLLILQALRQV